jgi:anthranilate synthase component 1
VPGSVLRALAARFPERYPVLMDSAAEGPLSRFSILAAEPSAALWIDAEGVVHTEGVSLPTDHGFFNALEQWWLRERTPWAPGAPPPFAGGWTLFISYEMAREIEPRLVLPRSALPYQAFALRTPCALIHDLHGNRVFAIAESGFADRLDRIAAEAKEIAVSAEAAANAPAPRVRALKLEEEDPAIHIDRVVRAN